MTVNIHGNEYVTVAERLVMAREAVVSLVTEIVSDTPETVTVRATVLLTDGRSFQGHAASRKKVPGIEGQAPLEVAETSAVGRALGFAGYGAIESIASAEEVIVAQSRPAPAPPKSIAQSRPASAPSQDVPASVTQCDTCGSARVYREGTSKAGVPYKGYFCPGRECKGKPVWINDKKPLTELAGDDEEMPFE